MDFLTIPLASAMVRLAMAIGIWCLALAFTLPRERTKLVRGGAVTAVLVLLGLAFGPPLLLTFDSTVDLALGQSCLVTGHCTTMGVGASHGGFEGGVLWDWILAALFAVSDSPRWLELSFLLVHAIGAGVVASLADDTRTGLVCAALFFAVSFGLAPGYIAFHPTLAPTSILPAVLLATQRFAEPDEGRHVYVRAVLLGASYGVGLGVYIAALFLGTLLVLGVLRGRLGELVAIAAGFVAEQAIVTPGAAHNNLQSIGLDSILVGVVLLGVLLIARRRAPSWMHRYPMSVVLGLAFATFVAGAVVARHAIWPFYVGMCAPMFAGAWAELAGEDRRWPRALRTAIAALAIVVTAICSFFYRSAADQFHEGIYRYRDIHSLGSHFHRGHGVSVSSPSYAPYYSLHLWPADEPAAAGRGVALWRADESGPGICVPGTEQSAGRLRMCEYEAWAQTEGARKCRALLDDIDPSVCESADDPAAYELTLLTSPIHYARDPDEPLEASFVVPVCAHGEGERILEPVVFPAYPLRPKLRIREPAWGELTESGDGVRVRGGDEPRCGVLEWEWTGEGEPLVGWAQDRVAAESFDYLVFFVRERASDR